MAGSVNKVILIGNLGRDPDVRRMTSGEPVVNLSVATSESWRDKASGERKERTDKDGQEKYSTEVVLNRFRGELVMLDSRGEGAGAGAPRSGGGDAPASFDRGEMDDEIPF